MQPLASYLTRIREVFEGGIPVCHNRESVSLPAADRSSRLIATRALVADPFLEIPSRIPAAMMKIRIRVAKDGLRGTR